MNRVKKSCSKAAKKVICFSGPVTKGLTPLTLIISGGKSNLIVWGADLPRRLLWCFYDKIQKQN